MPRLCRSHCAGRDDLVGSAQCAASYSAGGALPRRVCGRALLYLSIRDPHRPAGRADRSRQVASRRPCQPHGHPGPGVSAEVQGVLDGILEELRANAMTDASARNVQSRSALASISLPLTLQGLLNAEVGLALELMFGALPPERWAAVPAVSYAVASELTRAPVGGLL